MPAATVHPSLTTWLPVLPTPIFPQPDTGILSTYDGNPAHPGHKLLADPAQYAAIESDLVFLGLVGLQDPPRPEVAGAIKQVRAVAAHGSWPTCVADGVAWHTD